MDENVVDTVRARVLAEQIGNVVRDQRPADALAALQMNVARIFIDASERSIQAETCASAFGRQLRNYIFRHWHMKRKAK